MGKYVSMELSKEFDCIFCEIIETEVAEDFKYAGAGVVSFVPLNPVTPGHRLFVPKRHAYDGSLGPSDAASAFEDACDWAAELRQDFNLITSGGLYATQTIFHTHIHYVPRRYNDGLLLPWSNQNDRA